MSLQLPYELQDRVEFFRFLGHYAAYVGLEQMFQEYLSVPCSRVKLSKKDSLTLEDGNDMQS